MFIPMGSSEPGWYSLAEPASEKPPVLVVRLELGGII